MGQLVPQILKLHTVMVPRDQIEALLEANAQLADVVETSVARRSKRLAAAVLRRAEQARNELQESLKNQ